MYDLINFSERELRMLSHLLQVKIQQENEEINWIKSSIRKGEIHNELTKVRNENIATAKELNVRVLTALGIVKNRQAIQSN